MSGLRARLRGAAAGAAVTLDAAQVRAVLTRPSITEVPGASPSLRGLFAWRERVVPLVTLAPHHWGSVAVVLESGGEHVAVELEAVHGLVESDEAPSLDAAAARALVTMSATQEER